MPQPEPPLTLAEKARIAALIARGATRQLGGDEEIPTPDLDRQIAQIKDGARRRAERKAR